MELRSDPRPENTPEVLFDGARFIDETGIEGRLSAAGLRFAKLDVAAGAFQHFGHGDADLRENLVHQAGDENRDARPRNAGLRDAGLRDAALQISMCPSRNLTALPAMRTRSPKSRQRSSPPPRREIWRACEAFGLAQAFGPIRNQSAVRRAGDRIFVNALGRREKSRDEIAVVARRGHDHSETIHRRECSHIRRERELAPRFRTRTDNRGRRASSGCRAGCVQAESYIPTVDGTGKLKAQRSPSRSTTSGCSWWRVGITGADDSRRIKITCAEERRMTAQIDFDDRCEPAQMVATAIWAIEGGFGQIVFRCDRLHGLIRQPTVERANSGRIATEEVA